MIYFAAAAVLAHVADPASGAPETAADPATKASAEIQFQTPVFDFGKALSGELVKHDYIFTNTGKATLVVSAVQPKCGCTMTSPWTKEVEPGNTGIIPIQFNTSGYNGPVTKYIEVVCNAKATPNIILQLKGTIHTLLEVEPTRPLLTVLSDSETNAVAIARIINHADTPVTLSDVHCSNPEVSAKLTAIKPGQEFEVRMETVPPLSPGNGEAVVTIKTSLQQMPVLTINGLLFSRPAVLALPGAIMVQQGPLTGVETNMVRVINYSYAHPTLTLTNLSINAPGVGVKMREGPAKSYQIMLTFPPGFVVPKGTNVELTVETSHPQFPVLKIPVIERPQVMPPPQGRLQGAPGTLRPPPGDAAGRRP